MVTAQVPSAFDGGHHVCARRSKVKIFFPGAVDGNKAET